MKANAQVGDERYTGQIQSHFQIPDSVQITRPTYAVQLFSGDSIWECSNERKVYFALVSNGLWS